MRIFVSLLWCLVWLVGFGGVFSFYSGGIWQALSLFAYGIVSFCFFGLLAVLSIKILEKIANRRNASSLNEWFWNHSFIGINAILLFLLILTFVAIIHNYLLGIFIAWVMWGGHP